MAQIAFILLAHRDPAAVIAQARALAAGAEGVAIHYDGRSPPAEYRQIAEALAGTQNVAFTPARIRCGWGEWSLVAATLTGLRTALQAFPEATHLYLVSADCAPIKSATFARGWLGNDPADHIEAHDFLASNWIRTGMKEERLIYRHLFNERRAKPLFYASLDIQRRLRLARPLPEGLRIMIGSQWWCLRRATAEAILRFIAERPDIPRFFRTTWIPDETFFQSLVRHLVPEGEIRNRAPTFTRFTDYGMPVTFYNDHYDLLLAEDALFARKISPEATDLRARLRALWTSGEKDQRTADQVGRLHAFLTERGRAGQRFAPRFWEAEATLPRHRTLRIVTCKKWHVAQRLVAAIRRADLMPAHGYIFDDHGSDLPDLGGAASTLEKRQRHRRALIDMIYTHYGSDSLLICVDPKRLDILTDLNATPADIRVLELQCALSDDWLDGHAMRAGRTTGATPWATRKALLPAILSEIEDESEAIAKAGLRRLHTLREGARDTAPDKALSLAAFLDIPPPDAAALIDGIDLFAD